GLTSRLVHLYGAINLLFQRLKIVGWNLIWQCFDCIGRHKRTFPNKEVRTCSQYTPDFCGGMGPSVHFLAGLKSLTTKDTKLDVDSDQPRIETLHQMTVVYEFPGFQSG